MPFFSLTLPFLGDFPKIFVCCTVSCASTSSTSFCGMRQSLPPHYLQKKKNFVKVHVHTKVVFPFLFKEAKNSIVFDWFSKMIPVDSRLFFLHIRTNSNSHPLAATRTTCTLTNQNYHAQNQKAESYSTTTKHAYGNGLVWCRMMIVCVCFLDGMSKPTSLFGFVVCRILLVLPTHRDHQSSPNLVPHNSHRVFAPNNDKKKKGAGR